MILREVSIANIRSYVLFSASLNPGVTLILGRNGSGKTSLLEAIYFLARGTSFRGRDSDMVRHDSQIADLKLEFENGEIRRARLQNTAEKVTKSFFINDHSSQRLPTKNRIPVILFEPDELRLISSSPSRRRDFIDGIISRLYPSYATLLSRYNRTLLQRNELLKQHDHQDDSTWDGQLFAWDVEFAELASRLVQERLNFIEKSNAHLSRLYSKLAGTEHMVSVDYQSPLPLKNYKQTLLSTIHRQRYTDALRGHTSAGPHRDDILITLDHHPAIETASRGEMRTIMLAYKLLEVELQTELSAQTPLILMDDVFSELDITREKKLMHALNDYQTIITATDLRDELKIDASIINL